MRVSRGQRRHLKNADHQRCRLIEKRWPLSFYGKTDCRILCTPARGTTAEDASRRSGRSIDSEGIFLVYFTARFCSTAIDMFMICFSRLIVSTAQLSFHYPFRVRDVRRLAQSYIWNHAPNPPTRQQHVSQSAQRSFNSTPRENIISRLVSVF